MTVQGQRGQAPIRGDLLRQGARDHAHAGQPEPLRGGRVKAGLRKITVHDVRRTCASLLAALDVHPRVAMRILRHAQIDVTMNVYTEVSDAKTLQALKRLAKQLGS